MELPGIKPATSWLVVRHADHLGNEVANNNNNLFYIIPYYKSVATMTTFNEINKKFVVCV